MAFEGHHPPAPSFEEEGEYFAQRHDAFTPMRRARFLDVLSREGEVLAACRAAGVSRQTAYTARRRDGLFARGWGAALVLARGHVEDVLASRALHGVEEDVFYHGEKIATRRRFDTRLLLAHLARLDAICEETLGGDDAPRFDELVAMVGGEMPPPEMMDTACFGVAEDAPLLPMARAEYAALLVNRADWYDRHDDDEDDEDADEDIFGDAEADDPDEADAGKDEAETGEPAGPGWLETVQGAAEAEWDEWHARACRFVDAVAGDVAAGRPEVPDQVRDDDGAGADELPPMEYKSLEFAGLDRVRCVNFGRLTRLRRMARRWYGPRLAGSSGGDSGAKGKAMNGTLSLSMRNHMRRGGAAACAGLAMLAPDAALAAGDSVAIAAELTGAQVVGQAADTDGSGRFAATLSVKARQLCYELEVRLIGPASAAAIYAGRLGARSGAGLVSLAVPDVRGRSSGCVAVSGRAAKVLAANPDAAHVTVINPLYPAGALRGQLGAGGSGVAAADDAEPVRAPAGERTQYTGPVFTGS